MLFTIALVTSLVATCKDNTEKANEGEYTMYETLQECAFTIESDPPTGKTPKWLKVNATSSDDNCLIAVYSGNNNGCPITNPTFQPSPVSVQQGDSLATGTVRVVIKSAGHGLCSRVDVTWETSNSDKVGSEIIIALILAFCAFSPLLFVLSPIGTLFVASRHRGRYRLPRSLELNAFIFRRWRWLFVIFFTICCLLGLPAAILAPHGFGAAVAVIIVMGSVQLAAFIRYRKHDDEHVMDLAYLWTPLKTLQPGWTESQGTLVWPSFEIISAIVTWISVGFTPGDWSDDNSIAMIFAAVIETIGGVLIVSLARQDRVRAFKARDLASLVKSNTVTRAGFIAALSYFGDMIALTAVSIASLNCPLPPILFFNATKAFVFNQIRGLHISILLSWRLVCENFWSSDLDTFVGNTELSRVSSGYVACEEEPLS
eukprot:TRINITY_DN16113_c0_g1_i1.p1 TRINITY_DN16113_c0_g1~~TRINITY_DN16113_c0_g1_i1.p1  ORF type:complete len:436 (+),score=15.17 TRINITY_DN16113_c0_g1_i1:23-1309(+)